MLGRDASHRTAAEGRPWLVELLCSKFVELDAIGRHWHFDSDQTDGCVRLAAPLWCGLGFCSRTLVVF